jgi:hypothetical protein
MRTDPVEGESGWQRMADAAETFYGSFPDQVTSYLEFPGAGHADFNLVAVFKLKRVHQGRWQAYRETISPLRYLHDSLLDIQV